MEKLQFVTRTSKDKTTGTFSSVVAVLISGLDGVARREKLVRLSRGWPDRNAARRDAARRVREIFGTTTMLRILADDWKAEIQEAR